MSDTTAIPFDDDSPEWTEEMFASARPAHEVPPAATVALLVRPAIPGNDEDTSSLYLAAFEVEQDERLNLEMAEWEATLGDGLSGLERERRGG